MIVFVFGIVAGMLVLAFLEGIFQAGRLAGYQDAKRQAKQAADAEWSAKYSGESK